MLNQNELNQIRSIVAEFIDMNKFKVFIFGSRALGSARKFSDIDIGIEGKTKVPGFLISEMEEKFEQSDTPYTFDIVDFSTVSSKFKTIASGQRIPLN